MKNMKIFKDGKMLYICIEDPSADLESILLKMLSGGDGVEKISDVAEEDNEILPPEQAPDTSNMQELTIKTPPVEKKPQPVAREEKQIEKKPVAEMSEGELKSYLLKMAHDRDFLVYVKTKYQVTGYMKRFIERSTRDVLMDIAQSIGA